MAPEHVVSIVQAVGAWPIATVFLVAIVAPWAVLVLTNWFQERRFEEVKNMYASNAELVKRSNATADSLAELVRINTEALTRACDALDRVERRPNG